MRKYIEIIKTKNIEQCEYYINNFDNTNLKDYKFYDTKCKELNIHFLELYKEKNYSVFYRCVIDIFRRIVLGENIDIDCVEEIEIDYDLEFEKTKWDYLQDLKNNTNNNYIQEHLKSFKENNNTDIINLSKMTIDASRKYYDCNLRDALENLKHIEKEDIDFYIISNIPFLLLDYNYNIETVVEVTEMLFKKYSFDVSDKLLDYIQSEKFKIQTEYNYYLENTTR